MKVSYLWLKQFVDFDVNPKQLAEDLSMVGVVVESVDPVGNDHVFDLDITTNRPDCLSHLGVAREIAARYGKALKQPEMDLEESVQQTASEISVAINSPALCARYCARVIRGVTIGPSPTWLAQRLESLGTRSINNIVDVTNYVLQELGHPLHAFDLSRVHGRRIIVREALPNESLVTLDGESRELGGNALVIADPDRALALAGIMGGTDSEIRVTSTDVLIESAWFDPINIRRTAKTLGIHTEASHRFERGADVAAARQAIDRAAHLMHRVAGGEILSGVVDVYANPVERSAILLRRSRIEQVMGVQIEDPFIERTLTKLGFELVTRSADGWAVRPPTSRLDVEREIDLIEEIARHYGYERFESTLPRWTGQSHPHPYAQREKTLKHRLLGLGYSEAVTYSFVALEENERFSREQPVCLKNPLSLENAVMRTSLVPGLLASLSRNYNRGIKTLQLYEVGRLYLAENRQGEREKPFLGIIVTGSAQEKTLHADARPWSFFDLKGDLEVLCDALSIPTSRVKWKSKDNGGKIPDYYHPGVCAELVFEGSSLGYFGQLHPKVGESYKIKQPVFLAELPLNSWYGHGVAERTVRELPKYPSVQRDISIILDRETPYETVETTICQAGVAEVQQCCPFDLYLGDRLPPGKKSLSISIVYQSANRTLIEEEVNNYHGTILRLLQSKLGAELRS